jgi:hypothetical protein
MSIRSALVADRHRRQHQDAERATATPPEQLAARNAALMALSGLSPWEALTVIDSIRRSLAELIATQAKAGW